MRLSYRVAAAFLLVAIGIVALVSACSGSEPQDRIFAMTLVGGELASVESELSANQGDTVTLTWQTDTSLLVHLHGYDIEMSLTTGRVHDMTFNANATGRFNITVHAIDDEHPHKDGEGCRASPPPGEPMPSVTIDATEAMTDGRVIVQVEVENFELRQGADHWHLAIDGVDYGMHSQSSLSLPLAGGGERVFEATLNDANHCAYDASDTTTLMLSGEPDDSDDMMDETPAADHDMAPTPDAAGEHSMAGMTSEDATASPPIIEERVIATLEVRP